MRTPIVWPFPVAGRPGFLPDLRRDIALSHSITISKMLASKTKDGLVFPNGKGKIDSLANIVGFGLKPAMIRAGVTAPVLDGEGNPVVGKDGRPLKVAKYTGLHCLRHFFASFCINSKEDGGMALQPKIVQERLGHSTIVVTLDV